MIGNVMDWLDTAAASWAADVVGVFVLLLLVVTAFLLGYETGKENGAMDARASLLKELRRKPTVVFVKTSQGGETLR